MKFLKILVLLQIIAASIQKDEEPTRMSFRFKSVRCENYNSSLVNIRRCFVKAYSRTLSTGNICVDVLKTLRGPIIAFVEIKYRFNTITRHIYPTVRVDYCRTMKNEKLMEPLVRFIIGLFRDSIPQLIVGCPINIGVMNMTNITIPERLWPMAYVLPTGESRRFDISHFM